MVAVLVGAVGVVASVSLAVVDIELETVVTVESGFTTLKRDIVLSQVAHGSGFGGSSSNRPMLVSQQSAAWSQQNDVSVAVTLLQDIKSGPSAGTAFQAWLAGALLINKTADENPQSKRTYLSSSRGGNRATPSSDPYTTL